MIDNLTMIAAVYVQRLRPFAYRSSKVQLVIVSDGVPNFVTLWLQQDNSYNRTERSLLHFSQLGVYYTNAHTIQIWSLSKHDDQLEAAGLVLCRVVRFSVRLAGRSKLLLSFFCFFLWCCLRIKRYKW